MRCGVAFAIDQPYVAAVAVFYRLIALVSHLGADKAWRKLGVLDSGGGLNPLGASRTMCAQPVA